MKKAEIDKHVSIWDNNAGIPKGSTGTIVHSCRSFATVELDGYDKSKPFYWHEIYFPQHPLGYNQECFQ